MADEYKVPHVYTALYSILKGLAVEKNGSLPSNMGGKPYITAVDLNLEIKNKFVENNLILIPREREVSKNVVSEDGGRKTITISIEGEYQIVSVEDESSVTIGGVGDGLAIGSAVAANIASTNALKNALLRTFLVTEQSTEDEGKHGPAAPPAAVTRAKETTDGLTAARNELVALTGSQQEGKKAGDEFFKVKPTDVSTWTTDEAKIRELIAHLKAKK